MSFFPHDPTKYRPVKHLLRADLIREADRAIQEGLGGYENRHEVLNDALEQFLVELRYGDEEHPVAPQAQSQIERRRHHGSRASANGAAAKGNDAGRASVEELIANVEPVTDMASTAIAAPADRGAVVENEIAEVHQQPQLGLHNRDAPSAFALALLAEQAKGGPVPMKDFYESATAEAWRLAAALAPWEQQHGDKVTVMLPRNMAKPQTAAEGFGFFGIGQVNRRPDESGRLACYGPFYQWKAAGLLRGQDDEVLIGVTEAGWDLLEAFDGLDFGLPHDQGVARRFLHHLARHAPADLWGFSEALTAIAAGTGRVDLTEQFRARLADDYPREDGKAYTPSMAESIAQGYLSRTRAWGMVEPKLIDGKYRITDFGESITSELQKTETVRAGTAGE